MEIIDSTIIEDSTTERIVEPYKMGVSVQEVGKKSREIKAIGVSSLCHASFLASRLTPKPVSRT
jgi:hypothetical protein